MMGSNDLAILASTGMLGGKIAGRLASYREAKRKYAYETAKANRNISINNANYAQNKQLAQMKFSESMGQMFMGAINSGLEAGQGSHADVQAQNAGFNAYELDGLRYQNDMANLEIKDQIQGFQMGLQSARTSRNVGIAGDFAESITQAAMMMAGVPPVPSSGNKGGASPFDYSVTNQSSNSGYKSYGGGTSYSNRGSGQSGYSKYAPKSTMSTSLF